MARGPQGLGAEIRDAGPVDMEALVRPRDSQPEQADVHRVDEDEVKESKEILKKMNFDRL